MSQYDPNQQYNPNDQYGTPQQYAGAQHMSHGFAESMFAADAQVSERVKFIQRTYLHLGLAVIAFAVLCGLVIQFLSVQQVVGLLGGYNMLFVMGAYIGVSYLARYWASSDAGRPLQYAGLALYTVAKAAIFAPLLVIANEFAPGAISTAAIATGTVFGGLTLFVFVSKADFSFMRMFLAVGSLAALAAIVASIFMGTGLGIWFGVAMVVLMAGYIVYDTSNMIHHFRTDQHVAAALNLFCSLATLFYYILYVVMLSRE